MLKEGNRKENGERDAEEGKLEVEVIVMEDEEEEEVVEEVEELAEEVEAGCNWNQGTYLPAVGSGEERD